MKQIKTQDSGFCSDILAIINITGKFPKVVASVVDTNGEIMFQYACGCKAKLHTDGTLKIVGCPKSKGYFKQNPAGDGLIHVAS